MTVTTEKPASDGFPSSLSDIQIRDIIQTLPDQCFEKDWRLAWRAVGISLGAAALGYWAIAVSPLWLLPLAWIFTGTALTGWFVIAHDCGHRSFAKKRWVNDWVGHFFMLPLIYPFHSWRLLHDHHHVHTNKYAVDNAWHPWDIHDYLQAPIAISSSYRAFRSRLWWMASIIHWAGMHFAPGNVAPRDRAKVKTSVVVVLVFAAIAFPTLIATTGLWGLVKFWLMPWLVYHFWMSTFTLVHHTSMDIQFHPAESWQAAQAQLAGTVHCTYPRWIEMLCHDINVHIPHHVSVAIPSYRLRQAHRSLKQHWRPYVQEQVFSWRLLKGIVDYCHLYHPTHAYQRFCETRR
ncbi:fatty acid desaturase [Leptolyngbya sp. PCC 6406]|uniref:fatty acid desaturase n=1 Tax=Leptolyngbya sp. PCC 6406 TaxID=1173264 RepID=UPI0002ABB74E|nr:fatty acid desaturase [Leptolyngbya sp. PCC 6406]